MYPVSVLDLLAQFDEDVDLLQLLSQLRKMIPSEQRLPYYAEMVYQGRDNQRGPTKRRARRLAQAIYLLLDDVTCRQMIVKPELHAALQAAREGVARVPECLLQPLIIAVGDEHEHRPTGGIHCQSDQVTDSLPGR